MKITHRSNDDGWMCIRTSEHRDIRTSEHQNIRISEHQDIRTSGYQNIRTSRNWIRINIKELCQNKYQKTVSESTPGSKYNQPMDSICIVPQSSDKD